MFWACVKEPATVTYLCKPHVLHDVVTYCVLQALVYFCISEKYIYADVHAANFCQNLKHSIFLKIPQIVKKSLWVSVGWHYIYLLMFHVCRFSLNSVPLFSVGIYTASGIKLTLLLLSRTLQNEWPISKIISLTELAVNYCITLWNIWAQKIALLQNWIKWTALKTQPFETVAESIRHLLHWRKDIHSGHTKKKLNNRLYAPVARKKDIVTKCLHAHDWHSVSHWWHQSASHKWSIIHQFDTCRCGKKSPSLIHCVNVMLL